jgi:phosphoribosyl-AMP cyclohydrolase / phosphoribosyl-ATP pyrophosphohydrolase
MKLEEIVFDERGLVPAIVQDARTRQVLTLAYMNRESLSRTVETGETWFWSRSRARLWHKGESSGHTQRVVSITLDCDKDALNVLVLPNGPACHKGEQSCFHQVISKTSLAADALSAPSGLGGTSPAVGMALGEVLSNLYSVIETRREERPEGSYTTYLFEQGLDKILKKIGEECAETIIAAKNEDRDALVREVSDLLYHLTVLLAQKNLTLEEVGSELRRRRTAGNA